MAICLEKIKELNPLLAFFRFKKMEDGSYLLTNDIWKFVFLDEEDFQKLFTDDLKTIKNYEDLEQNLFIKTPNYEEQMRELYKAKNSFLNAGPSLHMIVTTLRCNHTCKYCHAAVAPMSAEEFDMTEETAKKVVDAILHTSSNNIMIEFQWGESLVNFDVMKYIVEYARWRALYLKKDLIFYVVTNLTLMTEEKLKWLMDNDVSICTSLDWDKVSHNNNRIWKDWDSFDTVTYWLKKVNDEHKKIWKHPIWALLTTTKETIDNYKEIIDTYVWLGLPGIFLRTLNPYWFAGSNLDKLAYSYDEWFEFYKNSLDYIIDINEKGTYFEESLTMTFLKKIFKKEDPGFMDIRNPSWIWIWGVAYNYDWKIYASDESRMLWRMWDDTFLLSENCDTGEEMYNNLALSDSLKTIVASSTLDWIPGLNDHVYKAYLGVDIIHNYQVTGSLYTPYAKDEKIKLYEKVLDHIFMLLKDENKSAIIKSWIAEEE